MMKATFDPGKVSSFFFIAILVVGSVYFGQTGNASAASFGFDKNTKQRTNADAESVAGCMQSCEDMLVGWLEMNPNSKNYTRQQEKIEAKAQQCLAMNVLAGFPFGGEEILQSCGLGQQCVELPRDIPVDSGACTDISLIGELHLPQCCVAEPPLGINCGVDAEWVVGVAAFPVCFIPNS